MICFGFIPSSVVLVEEIELLTVVVFTFSLDDFDLTSSELLVGSLCEEDEEGMEKFILNDEPLVSFVLVEGMVVEVINTESPTLSFPRLIGTDSIWGLKA